MYPGGRLKAQHGLAVCNPSRQCEQVGHLRHLAAVSNLDPEFTEKFLAFLSEEFIRQHELVARTGAEDVPLATSTC
jgi:chorismate mutase